VVAAAVSLFVLTSPPSPHLPALTFVLLFLSSFGLRSHSLVPICLCPLGCLPVQPTCGLRSHSFVPAHPAYLCLFPSCLAFVRAHSFVCCPRSFVPALVFVLLFLSLFGLCLRSFVPACPAYLCLFPSSFGLRLRLFEASICTRLCPLTPLIWSCSCLCLAFAWARSCPPASCLCPYQIHN
jgi:hypothetical protein